MRRVGSIVAGRSWRVTRYRLVPSDPVSRVLDRLPAPVTRAGAGFVTQCPAHDDQHASLSIGEGDDGRVLLKCHAGCDIEAIVSAFGLSMKDLYARRNGDGATEAVIVETYDYVDEAGALLFQVVRYQPKAFRQRRPTGQDTWIWSLGNVRRVIYRLDRLHATRPAAVFIVEGEKDVATIETLKFPATTNAAGAGKWRPEYTAQLVACGIQRAYVLPDHDEPGRAHAETVAAACHAGGIEVRIVALPDLPKAGDVSDWLKAGHTRDDLVRLAKATAVWTLDPPKVSTLPAAPLVSLLADVEAFIRRYVVVTDHQAVVVTLFTAHTHVIEAADCTPYLQITSATKRAGKTRLLEVLETVVARPWFTGRTSAAALMRKVDAECPTLLLDESDAAFGSEKEYAETLRGQLNTGYRSSGKTTVCIGQGAHIQARDFRTFSPKAIAGIGKLPDTIADRCVPIELRRRTNDEPCERWRERDGRRQGAPIHQQLSAWAAGAIAALRSARPALPTSLGDRQADVWEPLVAIADAAGGAWPERARKAATVLSGSVEDTDVTIELLRDVAAILADHSTAVIPTKELLEKLVEQDDRPWATWRKDDKPITARGLTRLLGPLGIHPDRHLRTKRGYRVDAFSDAMARYLPLQVSQRHNANEIGPESAIAICHSEVRRDTCQMRETSMVTDVVTHRHIETRGEGTYDTQSTWDPTVSRPVGRGDDGRF
jgi:Protein of unknown function (DUF3631)